jgi:hypothetical protein
MSPEEEETAKKVVEDETRVKAASLEDARKARERRRREEHERNERRKEEAEEGLPASWEGSWEGRQPRRRWITGTMRSGPSGRRGRRAWSSTGLLVPISRRTVVWKGF